MNGSYLLDTNIVIALFADETVVKNSLAKANEVFISSITVGELYYGAKNPLVQQRIWNELKILLPVLQCLDAI